MWKPLIIFNFISRSFFFFIRMTGHFLNSISIAIRCITRFIHITKTSEEKKKKWNSIYSNSNHYSHVPFTNLSYEMKFLSLNNHILSSTYTTHLKTNREYVFFFCCSIAQNIDMKFVFYFLFLSWMASSNNTELRKT
jgi:hypothetical protein